MIPKQRKIVESGSNENGAYTKFLDGTMIIRNVLHKSIFMAPENYKTTVQGIDIYRSDAPIIYFAQSFINTNYSTQITVNTGINGSRLAVPRICDKQVNALKVQLLGLESFLETGLGYTNLIDVEFTAIGKWK